jgi:hypothetical protein
MGHGRELIFRFFRELVSIFGKEGAVTIVVVAAVFILVVLVLVVISGYILLKFGEATVDGMGRFIVGIARVLRYHPRQANMAIRVELYLESILALVVLVCVVVIAAHALIPWVTAHTEMELGLVVVSSLVIFAFLGYYSMRIAAPS